MISLVGRRKLMIEYLTMKLEESDWHGVADAAMDLREIEVEIRNDLTKYTRANLANYAVGNSPSTSSQRPTTQEEVDEYHRKQNERMQAIPQPSWAKKLTE